ncbi:MAG: hydrogenase maturation protease [Desulfurococcaceae archaeon]
MGGSVEESEQCASIENKILESFLEDVFCRSNSIIAFVGSPLRKDDRFGLVLYDEIGVSNPRIVRCEYGLENCLDEITVLKPDELIVVDAVYSSKHNAGDIVLLELMEYSDENTILSTHTIPTTVIINILRNMGIKKIYLIGVAVKDISLGLEISMEVSKAINELKIILQNVIKKCLF